MRLFIAINFSEATKTGLTALRDELRSKSERGNFTLMENLHLTLAFLGECGAKQSAAAQAVMNTISFQPFDVMIDRVGRFKRDGGDIWWAGAEQSKALVDLQSKLTDRLIAAGFALDRRKYSPHITLGREVVTDATPWQTRLFGETVSRIALMKSERMGGKLTYAAIYEIGRDQTLCPHDP